MSSKLMPAKLAYLCTGLWDCEDEEAIKLLAKQITAFLEERPSAADSINRNNEDRTPLHYAATNDQCLGLLILLIGQYNVDINSQSRKNETALSISRSHRGGKYSSEIYNYLKSISTVSILELDEDMESNLSDVSGSITISPNQPPILFDIPVKQEIKDSELDEQKDRKSSKKRLRQMKHGQSDTKQNQMLPIGKTKVRKVYHHIASEENMKEFWPRNVTYTNKNHHTKMQYKYRIQSLAEEFVEIKPHVNPKIGMGLFAKKLIPKDTYFEYTGRVTKRKDIIVHTPGQHCYVAGMDDLNFDLDASSSGNETRFINHYVGISDVPNVELLKAHFYDGPHILVRTVCDIEPTDELLLDYGPGFGNMISLDEDSDRSEIVADEEEEPPNYGTKFDPLDGFASMLDSKEYMQGLNDVNIGLYCGTQVAIKKFAKEKRPYLAYHWNRLKKIQHPKLMNVYDCGMLKSYAVMIMDFAPLGDLETFLKTFRGRMNDSYYYDKFVPAVSIDVAEAAMCLIRHNAQDVCNELRPERIFIFGELKENGGYIQVKNLQARVLWSQVDTIIRKLTNRPQTFWLGPPRQCFDEQRRIYTDYARILIYMIALRVFTDKLHTDTKEHNTSYFWKQFVSRVDMPKITFFQIKKEIQIMVDYGLQNQTVTAPEKKPEFITLQSDSEDL